jgi:hypothetical protein
MTRSERRAALIAEHGEPRMIWDKRADALRLIGKRDEVHPLDVVACAYRDRAAAGAWRESGESHNQPTLGIAELDGEIISVIDLRPQLADDGRLPTLLARPDDWDGPWFRQGCQAVERDGSWVHTDQCQEQWPPRCARCMDTGHVCEDHPDIPQEQCVAEDEGCGTIGIPCPACCSPVPEDGTHSITEAFTPDWQRS